MNAKSSEVLYLAIATVPALLAGLALNDAMDSLRSLPVIAFTTIVFALLLGFADRRVRPAAARHVSAWHIALLIGCAQAFALVPGTSRSGITMTAALMLGMSRAGAARFSFLLSIPIILGATLLKTVELLSSPGVVAVPVLLFATAVAALSAYACIALFLRVVESIGMMPFVIYRLALGALLGLLWLL